MSATSPPTAPRGSPRAQRPRSLPWVVGLVALVVAIVGLIAAAWVARDPRRRRTVLQNASRTWVRMEDAASRGSQRLSRRRHRIEEEARRIARDLWDVVDDLPLVPGLCKIPPVGRRPYAHGAYMGAAPALLADPRWKQILAFLMPDVYRDVRDVVGRGGKAGELIPMFENNPVMAAFGAWRSATDPRLVGDLDGDLDAMEWDVFLSADAVDRWEQLGEHVDRLDRLGDDLGAAEVRVQRAAVLRVIVDTMVVAHASTTDTLQEQMGLCQWADVRKTAKSALGGVEPGAWMDLFARALTLAAAPDADALRAAVDAMQDEPRIESHEACLMHTFARPIPIAEAVALYRRTVRRPQFSVVLEVKSLRVTAALLAALVEELNRRQIHVAAVGSFVLSELHGLSQIEQRVGDGRAALPGPRAILFAHFADDVVHGAERGAIPPGTTAMFNGASLLSARSTPPIGRGPVRYQYEVDEAALSAVAACRARFDLHLGLYVQESDCDADAAVLLSEIVRAHPDVFELGFAWGGVLDEVALEAGIGDHRGFGSQRVIARFRTGVSTVTSTVTSPLALARARARGR